MSEAVTVLPPNAGPVARALERAYVAHRPDLSPVSRMLDPWTCPAELIDWIAWAERVNFWDAAWPEARKREVIAGMREVHRRSGTPWGVNRILKLAGYGDAILIEGRDKPLIGDPDYSIGDGTWVIGWDDAHWADYRVLVHRPIFRREAERLAELLRGVAPARSRLRRIFAEAVQFEIGDGLWSVGNDIVIGATYEVEITEW